MKYILSLTAICCLLLVVPENATAQNKNIVTEEFNVHGVCDMCKARIENAAYIKGVKHCNWDKQTEILTVTFDTRKTSLDLIHKSIAAAGHDTSEAEADPEVYNKLPKCCAYKDGAHKH